MSALMIVLSLVALVVWLCFHIQPSKRLKKMGELLPGPKTYPIVGNLPSVGINPKLVYTYFDKFADQYGTPFRLFLGKDLYVFISKPEDMEVILAKSKQLTRGKHFMIAGEPWLGDGLVTCNETTWKVNRKLLAPAFHTKMLEHFVPIFNKNTQLCLKELEQHVDGPNFDMHQQSSICALRNICETAMGVTLDSFSKDGRFPHAMETLSTILILKMFAPYISNKFIYKFHPMARKEVKLIEYVDSITSRVIKSRKEEMERTVWKDSEAERESKGFIFLDTLLNCNREDPSFTEKQIRDEVNSFIVAGYDTVAQTISWTLYCLAKHRDMQEKVYEEAERIMGGVDRPVELKDVQEMKYLDQVMKEALRLYTTLPMINREASADIKLKNGLVVPAGAHILLWFYRMHNDPEVFPNPHIFDPERFSRENTVKRESHSFLPFGGGPRDCIGMTFAQIECKVVLSTLIRNFIFLPAYKQEDLIPLVGIVLTSDPTVHCKIKRRPQRVFVK